MDGCVKVGSNVTSARVNSTGNQRVTVRAVGSSGNHIFIASDDGIVLWNDADRYNRWTFNTTRNYCFCEHQASVGTMAMTDIFPMQLYVQNSNGSKAYMLSLNSNGLYLRDMIAERDILYIRPS